LINVMTFPVLAPRRRSTMAIATRECDRFAAVSPPVHNSAT
jgi:hypothetical protein